MLTKCPLCDEYLTPDGECEVCRMAASILADGGDPPASPEDADGSIIDLEAVPRSAPPFPSPAATKIPHPLPLPLDDPMRVLKKLVLGLMALTLLQGVIRMLLIDTTSDSRAEPFLLSFGVLAFLFANWRLLPDRAVGVFYLRSFRSDGETAAVRLELQRAFGRRVRISGIRDPRRRWPKVIRYMDALLFALRYSTVKYLNLEAGDDWLKRLWRSLSEARGAVVDISDTTSHVIREQWLCLRTLGLERVLFVGDTAREAPEWRGVVASVLELPPEAHIRVAVWGESRERRKVFRAEVVAFARALPKSPSGVGAKGSEIAFGFYELDGPIEVPKSSLWLEMIAGAILGSLLVLLLRSLASFSVVKSILILPLAFYFLLTVKHFLSYLLDCGSARERVLTALTFGSAFFLLYAAIVLPGVQKVREAAARMQTSNQLKSVATAMHNYADSNDGRLPSANAGRYDRPPTSREPPVSWRVKILPYLGEDNLYRRYKLDEPWDSPDNSRLIESMPRVYRHVSAPRTPVGYTHFRVFVTPSGSREPPHAVFVSGQPGPSLNSIPDGTSNTILVVEAAEAVPWTKPDELEYDRDKPLPKLGGVFREGFHTAMADGSVRFLPYDLEESDIRNLITADDGNVIDLDRRRPVGSR